jgi:hypothetical protein
MARHVIDRPSRPSGERTSHYLGIERSAHLHPGMQALRLRPEEMPAALRLRAFLDQARAELTPAGRHVADAARAADDSRVARYTEIARREGLHPAIAALHSRARDSAAVARMRAFLREARAAGGSTGRHVADGPRGASPSRPARYVELAHREGLHPSVRALRTRRGDATAMIRLREFLRIARGETG